MNSSVRLGKNQKIRLTNGQSITVVDQLGSGGQGLVYRVRIDATGQEKALKWYFPTKLKNPQEFYTRLRDKNIYKGAPSEAFVWPEALTEWVNGTFGYIMRIYPNEYKGFPKYLLRLAKFSSTEAMLNAGVNISLAFKHLHNQGWNYQDLNDGNFAIEPKHGRVLICDNDNVVGHGEFSGVLGKLRYMAPEIVRGERPSKITDRYSLAVVLFMLLTRNHPLEGKKTNVPALTYKFQKRFFGTEPVFIFDPKDKSNVPREGLHVGAIKLWPYFPEFLKNAFQKSFSHDSLYKAEGRVLEEQWVHVFMRLKSSIIKCPHCNEEIYLEGKSNVICPKCKKSTPVAGYLKFPKRADMEIIVPLSAGVHLYEYHVESNVEDSGYEKSIATILEKPGKIGIKNESKDVWTIIAPSGQTATKQAGEVAVMGVGFKIDFGHKIVAEVISNK